MKILFMLDSIIAYQSGIWFHRNEMPSLALEKRGHSVKQVAIGKTIPDEFYDWCDVVVFGRAYNQTYDPVNLMKEFKKRGKRVIYDLDDDYWNVPKDNPSFLVASAFKDQYEGMIRECDAIITPSKVLAKKISKHFKKKVFICHNGVDLDSGRMYQYLERPHNDDGVLKVGYMGAASHWKDLQLIGKVVADLSKKYDFLFVIYGMVGEQLESAVYHANKMLQFNLQPEKTPYYMQLIEFYKQLQGVKMWHIPFMPPELSPKTLSNADFDIGLAPLEDNKFNSGKSCVKYYEYGAVGTVTLSSDVLPYKDEVTYRAKNTYKDWYNKLEKLIVNKEFREKELKKQQEWVKKNRSTEAIGLTWELALQNQKGMKVMQQEDDKKKK